MRRRHRGHVGFDPATVDVIPDAQRDGEAAGVGHVDDVVEGVEIFLLFCGGDADHFDVGEAFGVEEVGIAGGEEAAVFVAEGEEEGVEAVAGEGVEVGFPIGLIVEAAFEIGAIHGEGVNGALRGGGGFHGVADAGEGLAGVAPGDAVGGVEFGVHEAAVVLADEEQAGLAAGGSGEVEAFDEEAFVFGRGDEVLVGDDGVDVVAAGGEAGDNDAFAAGAGEGGDLIDFAVRVRAAVRAARPCLAGSPRLAGATMETEGMWREGPSCGTQLVRKAATPRAAAAKVVARVFMVVSFGCRGYCNAGEGGGERGG